MTGGIHAKQYAICMRIRYFFLFLFLSFSLTLFLSFFHFLSHINNKGTISYVNIGLHGESDWEEELQ